jgi:carbonic anhydrase/acetyltransferase-like protein (isoleucine patch superfamily)
MLARKAVHYFGRALRETGQALDRIGLRVAENEIFKETFTRHRPTMVINDKKPLVALDAFVAPNATLVGDVLMLTQSSVWYGAVLRGDKNKITVGAFSNIQDKVVIDCTTELETGFPAEVDILNHVTIGHGAVLRSCIIKDRCIVGMNAVISEGCVMERTSMVAAGSVLLPHTVVPSGQLWAGNPAVYIRDLKFEEIESFEKSAMSYVDLAVQHSGEFLPYGTAYQEAEKVGAA